MMFNVVGNKFRYDGVVYVVKRIYESAPGYPWAWVVRDRKGKKVLDIDHGRVSLRALQEEWEEVK